MMPWQTLLPSICSTRRLPEKFNRLNYISTTKMVSTLVPKTLISVFTSEANCQKIGARAGGIHHAESHFDDDDGQYVGSEVADISICIGGELAEDWGGVSVHHVLADVDLDGGDYLRLVGRWEDASAILFALPPTQQAP